MGRVRRQFVLALCASALAAPVASFAQQQRKLPRIGFLMPETRANETSRVETLRAGLRDFGYVEDQNIAIEYRSADGNYDRLPDLAAELTRLNVDVIVAFGQKAVVAAKRATTTIPIVDPVMGDPVAAGLSTSLARPGGNITGSVQFGPETGAKRLEFLKEAVPRVKRVALLINPANASSAGGLEAGRVTADALQLELQPFEVRSTKEFRDIFAAMAQRRIDAIVATSDTLFRANAAELAGLARMQGIPLIGPKEFAAAGSLIGYGVDTLALYRRAAYFVDRILKGAKPGDLPIERATKLELVINLKTAKALGITIPQALLVRADEVIQ
jgi:putative tryptophan/tyrosine transport system substrate-binding protein